MKKLESTKIRILLCSIIASCVIAEHTSSHRNRLPHHGSTSSPRRKSQSSGVPIGIQMPEKVMSTREVSCISADSNIFDIMKEAKETCKGKDMACTFYIFANFKYYNIGSLDINKELFDKLLMKYDNWLLTAKRIPAKDSVIYTKRDEKYRGRVKEQDTLSQSDSSAFIEENNIDTNTHNSVNHVTEHTSRFAHRNRAHMDTGNTARHINVKEKNGKYIELHPKYDKEHKFYEVFLPGYENQGKPRTINVNINIENEHESKSNVLMTNTLEEVSTVDNYDVAYENKLIDTKIDSLSTKRYDGNYFNENSYHNQKAPEERNIFLNKIKSKSFQDTEAGLISTDSYLEQPRIEIKDYSDTLDTNIMQNDTFTVDTNTGKISSANNQESLPHSVNIDASDQGMNFSNSDFEITQDTSLSEVAPQDTSNIELSSSITANNRDLKHVTNNALEEILIRSRNNDNVRAFNENTETLVLNDRSQTHIQSPDINQDINGNTISNTENKDGSENAHEKHNLTPLQNETKHMHELVDQATLHDDFHTQPLEYSNIYNEVDFDNTHLSVHDNNTLRLSNIHLNEPVFLTVDSFRENLTSPYEIAVPNFQPSYHTISDYIGTQIDITPPKNKSGATDTSAKSIPSLPTPHVTSIPDEVLQKTIKPDIKLYSIPNKISPSSTSPENTTSFTNSLLHSNFDSIEDHGSTLPTLALAPMGSLISSNMESEVLTTSVSDQILSDNKISLDTIPNSFSPTEGNSVSHQNELTICNNDSLITNNVNTPQDSSLLISPDVTSSQIELDVLPKSNWHIDQSPPSVITPVTQEGDVNFQQKPQSFLSKPTESSQVDVDFDPGTSLFEMASAKPVFQQIGQTTSSPTRRGNPYLQSYTEPVISNQFQTPTSETTTESHFKPSLLSEPSVFLGDNFSENAEFIPQLPSESIASLVPESQLQKMGIVSTSLSHEEPLPLTKISQPNSPSLTNNPLPTEELNYLNNNLQLDQVRKSLVKTPFSKAKQHSDILHNIPSKHKPLISLSSPISSSNYSPLTQSDVAMGLPAPLPHSGIPLSKYTNPHPNKDFAAIPSLKPYYSKIPHTPTSTVKPVFDTKLSRNQPLILDNDSVLAALNTFSKSTKTIPLLDEDFQRLITELPSDLTNLFLSESSIGDSQLNLPIIDSMKPSLNKKIKQKPLPTLEQYASIDETTQFNEKIPNLPASSFTDLKIQNVLSPPLGPTPVYIKPELPSNNKQDSSLKPSLPMEIIPELNKDSLSLVQPSSTADNSQIKSTLTDSYPHVSSSSAISISPIKDFSVATDSSVTSLPFDSKKVPLEIVPLTVQPDKSSQVLPISTNQLDIVSPKTLPGTVFDSTPGFESSRKQVDFSLYVKPVPSLSLNPENPKFYDERESLLETKLDNLLSDYKSTQFYEEKKPSLENPILATLASDATEKSMPSIQYPEVSLAPEESSISSFISTMESPHLPISKPALTSESIMSPVDRLLPLLNVPGTPHISELSISETSLSDLRPSNDLDNLHMGPKPIVLNQSGYPTSTVLPSQSVSTAESSMPQDSLKKYISEQYATTFPSNIPSDINRLSLEPFMQSDIFSSASLVVANIIPLPDTQKLQPQRPIQPQATFILPSAPISHSDQLDLLTSGPFASTTLDADSTCIPNYKPSLVCIPQLNFWRHPSKDIPKLPPISFYTPSSCENSVLQKSEPIVPQNSPLLTSNSFVYPYLCSQLPSQQYSIPLSPSLISEISQLSPLLHTQSELKNELPSVIGESSGNIRFIEDVDLHPSNLLKPVSFVDAITPINTPCQKVLQTPFTLPNQRHEFAAEPTINCRPCIESPVPINSNTVSLHPYTFVNEDISKNIPCTPSSLSSYVPVRPLLSPKWQIQPSNFKYLEAIEPTLCEDSQGGIADFSSIPCKPVFKPLLEITPKNEPGPEFSTMNSNIPGEDIPYVSVIKPSCSSNIQPMQYITHSSTSNILPNLVSAKYKPLYVNDIRNLLDEDVSQLLKGMSILPITQSSIESTLASQDKTVSPDEVITQLQSPITSNPIPIEFNPNRIGTRPLKDSDISLITNNIPLSNSQQKPTSFSYLLSPLPQKQLSVQSLPGDSALSFGEVPTVPSNVNPCSSESEILLPFPSRQPLDTLSQLEYKPISSDISSVETDISQNILSQVIPDVSETLLQDNSPSFDKMLIPPPTVLPIPMPCPPSSQTIYFNPPYSLKYPKTIPYELQRPLSLKTPKYSSQFSTLPVGPRPISADVSQPITSESLFSTASPNSASTTPCTDIDLINSKPQIVSKPAICIPLQFPSYSTPILLSETDVLPRSPIYSQTPQVIASQYTPKPYNVNSYSSESEILVPFPSSQRLDSNLLPNKLSKLECKPILSDISSVETDISQNMQVISDVTETLLQDNSPSFDKILIPPRPVLPIPMPCPTLSQTIYLNPPYSLKYPKTIPYEIQRPLNLKTPKDSLKFSTLPVCPKPISADVSQPIISESLFSTASPYLAPTTPYTGIDFAKLKPQIVSKPAISIPFPSYSTSILLSETDVLPIYPINSQTPQVIASQYTPKPSPYLKPLDFENITPFKLKYQTFPYNLDTISMPKLDRKLQSCWQSPCLQSETKVSSFPRDVNWPMAPTLPDYSAVTPTFVAPTQIKPSYTSPILLTSPLQIQPRASPVSVKSTPQYITQIIPTTPTLPLKSYSIFLQPTYPKPVPTAKSISILPIQTDLSKPLPSLVMPSYTFTISPSIPLKGHSITPSHVSVKTVSGANAVPLLPTQFDLNRLSLDYTSRPPSYTKLYPYSQSVYPKPLSLSPYKPYEAPYCKNLQEDLTPASFVETIPWASFAAQLSRPSAVQQAKAQPPVFQYSIPAALSTSQYSTPSVVSSPVSPTFTKSTAPAYSAPTLSFTSPTHDYMRPLSQKPGESPLPYYWLQTPASFTNNYVPLSSPSTTFFSTRSYTSSPSHIEPLPPINLYSQEKIPMSKSQKAPFKIPSYGKYPFVNEIQNKPMISNTNPMKNNPTDNLKSISASVSNIQMNQNNLEDNIIDETITAPTAETILGPLTSDRRPETTKEGKIFSEESIKDTYLESLSNILELDKNTEMILDEILSGPTPSISVPSANNTPLLETMIHKKSDLIPPNILQLEQGNEILLDEDLLQKGDYLPYGIRTTEIRSVPTEPISMGVLSKSPNLAPLQSYTSLLQSNLAPQKISLQSSSNFKPILSTPTLSLQPAFKSPDISYQLTSDVNPLLKTRDSLVNYACIVLPIQQQPQPSILSLPTSLAPSTDYKIPLEQSVPEYAPISSDLNPLVDNICAQSSLVPSLSYSSVPLDTYITPSLKMASQPKPESYATSPYIPHNSARYIKQSFNIPCKQRLPVQPSPIPINNNVSEVPTIIYSPLQYSILHESKTNIQPLISQDGISHTTLSNEGYPATGTPIYSQSNVIPTEFTTSSTTLTESENSLIAPVKIKASTALDGDILISQRNKLLPEVTMPHYSKLIGTGPYYTSNRPWSAYLQSDLKSMPQFSENQYKNLLTTPISYAQPKEALYETVKPHPKLISKPSQDQLNAPISLPLTAAEPECTEFYGTFKPHPKLLAALDQDALLQSTTDNSMTPFDIVPETYIRSTKPLMNTNFKSRPEIFNKIPGTLFPPSRLLPLGFVEESINYSPISAEISSKEQLYSSSLVKSITKPIYSKEELSTQTEVRSDHVECVSQPSMSVLDAKSPTNGEPCLLPSKDPLLQSQPLKFSLTTSQNLQIPPNLSQYPEITPPKQSPLTSNYEILRPSLEEIESSVTQSPISESSTVSMPNTLQNLPSINKYQSYTSMLPCDSQDISPKSQSSSLLSSPTMNIYPNTTPSSWTTPLSLTPRDSEFIESPITSFISPTYSPFLLNPLESYNTPTSKWNPTLPTDNAWQRQLLTPISKYNLPTNPYQCYSQYKLLQALPSPVAEVQNMEAATPFTLSSIPTASLTSSPLSSLDIPKLSDSTHIVSGLKSLLPVLTTTSLQSNEVSQTPSRYQDFSCSVFGSPSSIPNEPTIIGNNNLINSPLTISISHYSSALGSQLSSPAIPYSDVLKYPPSSTNIESELVNTLTEKPYIVSPKLNTAPFSSLLYAGPGNWLQSPIIPKSRALYETPFYQKIIPQMEYLKVNPLKVAPSNIVPPCVEALKERTNPREEPKLTLIEEPLKLNSVKPITPITLKGPNIKYEDINRMEIKPCLAEFSPEITYTKTLIETQSNPETNLNTYTKAVVSNEKYVDYQNIEPDKLTMNQISKIPQYMPSNKICKCSPYTPSTNYPSKIPEIRKLTTPDIFQISKAPKTKPIPLNSEKISEYAEFYANYHKGNIPSLFSIPSTIDCNYDALPINSEIFNDRTGNPIEYSVPKIEATPFASNEFKTICSVDKPIPIYNTNNVKPCLNSSPKITSSISPIDICQTPTDLPEISCQPIPFMSNNEIKYEGYKTYHPSPKILQSSAKDYPLPRPKYQDQILNIPPDTEPFQTELGLDNRHQSLKLDETILVRDIHNRKEIDKELKSMLINYINSKKDMKNYLFNNNAELSIPLGDLAINKKDPSDFEIIETNNPSIGLKVWKSNAKIVTAELKLKFKELSVNNFMPVINNLNEFDVEEIRKIVKNYIDEKYGHHIEIHEPYTVDNQYVVLKDFDQSAYGYKFNLLWPTEYV